MKKEIIEKEIKRRGKAPVSSWPCLSQVDGPGILLPLKQPFKAADIFFGMEKMLREHHCFLVRKI